MSTSEEYIQWFRGAAPYIKAHRKKTFVILISDEFIQSDHFIGLIHDIALLNHLGIKLIILHGSRDRINISLSQNGITSKFNQNIRISDAESLPYIIQAINEVKTKIESHLSMGLPNTPMSGSEISLVSGNFVTGMPLGVIDGIDMQHSGKVREVKHEVIEALLGQNHVILMSNIGFSRTGEVFNLPAEELASEVAKSIKADKLIFIHHHQWQETLPDTLSSSDCETLIHTKHTPDDLKHLLSHAVKAVKSTVKRVHIIDQLVDGGLLLELFTRNGCGTLITNLFYEGIRVANIKDIGGILGLIGPLESSGILVERSREQLELEIGSFNVIEKDGMIIACIACIPNSEYRVAEIACLAVHEDYQRVGFGEQLLKVAELRAHEHGIMQIYTLTTQTSHWFIEHGYAETTSFELPPHKLTQFNQKRRSKVLLKKIN
jgi:amino-acid N-acetyltransferase